MDISFYLPELMGKIVLLNTRHDKQNLVATITHKLIRFSNTAPYNINHCHKHHISCVMTACIIINLEVVKIYHRNARRHMGLFKLIFKISPVARTCQCISIHCLMIF